MARGDGFSIIKRSRGGRELANWQVRVQVPVDWQRAVGQVEVLRSLGTGDRRAAAQLAPAVVANLYAEWQQLAVTAPALNIVDPKAVAVRVAYDGMLKALEERRRTWPRDDEAYTARLLARDADLKRLTRRFQDGDLSQWESIADRSIASRALPITKDSAEYGAFVRAIAEASIDALNVFLRQAEGELGAEPRSQIVQETKAKEAATAKAGETLLDLFELWSAEALDKGEKRLDTIGQDRKIIQQFAAFVGHNRDIRSIMPLEVAEYRDTLRKLPPKWMSSKALRNLDMRTAAAKARELELPQTAFTTINKHLSTISPLYSWLGSQPRWAGLINPVGGLFYAKVKGKNRRPSFKTASLNKILQSPLFTGFRADDEEHLAGDLRADDWRYWIPLVCMFTGARIGEIAQIRVGDVREERGVWFIHIRHEEEEGLTTKSGKSRAAAVHPLLEQIGFLAFRKRQLERSGDNPDAPMFPELKPNNRGQISSKPSRWWRDYLSAIGLKSGADGMGAHSFRHTLADRLRDEAELMDHQIAVILGHSANTTTSGYGELPQGTVNMLKTWMDAIRFDGVNFDHLVNVERERMTAARSLSSRSSQASAAIASAPQKSDKHAES